MITQASFYKVRNTADATREGIAKGCSRRFSHELERVLREAIGRGRVSFLAPEETRKRRRDGGVGERVEVRSASRAFLSVRRKRIFHAHDPRAERAGVLRGGLHQQSHGVGLEAVREGQEDGPSSASERRRRLERALGGFRDDRERARRLIRARRERREERLEALDAATHGDPHGRPRPDDERERADRRAARRTGGAARRPAR